MDESIIMGMIAPYLKVNELTYHEFEQIFSMLSLRERYGVIEILIKNSIELVENHCISENVEKPAEDNQESVEYDEGAFELLYNLDLFADNDYDNDKPIKEEEHKTEYLKVREKVFLSNRALIKMIQEGDAQAKQDLCVKNQGLVDKVVNLSHRAFSNKVDFEDLEQAGMLGLIKAAQKFDLNKETEFSTYAVWWIKQAIAREIMDNGYTIRIPVHKMEQIQKVLKFDSQFAHETDYYKRLQLISEASKIPPPLVEDCLRLFYQFIQSTSLDLPIGEDEDTPLGELIPYESEMSVEDKVLQRMLKENMDEILHTLSHKEQKILQLRFGLIDGRDRTLEEVGREFGVTRERIRQIEEKVLLKLRHPSGSRKFKDFLD